MTILPSAIRTFGSDKPYRAVYREKPSSFTALDELCMLVTELRIRTQDSYTARNAEVGVGYLIIVCGMSMSLK